MSESKTTHFKAGLLPFFLKLYEEVCSPEELDEIKAFSKIIQREYEKRGVDVLLADTCCEAEQFAAAVRQFEAGQVDAIITLHLAYSPSLESVDALAGTNLPLILLDTTPDFDFGEEQIEDRILCNHGIHGVQDFCNLLVRRKKNFFLEAGHWRESDVIDRTISLLKGAQAAQALREARVGIIGKPFKGMGDFAIPFDVLKREIGMEVVSTTSDEIARRMPALDSIDVATERDADRTRFAKGSYTDDALDASEAAGLAVRNWIEEENLTAWTMNFSDITGTPGLPVVPFLEASKAMERGLGYAGEGDVLTAAFCGALAQIDPETTFTEMFCPDWKSNRILMSHMGEVNLSLTASPPVLEQNPYPFSAAGEPVFAVGCLKPGKAWLLNLAPGPDHTFSLVAARVDVCDMKDAEAIRREIRGWIKPPGSISDFLKQYSLHGGTHHCVLSYGVDKTMLQAWAQRAGWAFVEIE